MKQEETKVVIEYMGVLKNNKDVDEPETLILFDTGEVVNYSDENLYFDKSAHFVLIE